MAIFTTGAAGIGAGSTVSAQCWQCGVNYPLGIGHACNPHPGIGSQALGYIPSGVLTCVPLDLIAGRLRLEPGSHLPFDFITVYEVKDAGKVFVFIVNGDKPLTLEDDYGLFPSDQLITQLRLIMEN